MTFFSEFGAFASSFKMQKEGSELPVLGGGSEKIAFTHTVKRLHVKRKHNSSQFEIVVNKDREAC